MKTILLAYILCYLCIYILEHQMVKHVEAYDVFCLPSAACHVSIFQSPLQVDAGVVVGYMDGCCPLAHCLDKCLRLCLINRTL